MLQGSFDLTLIGRSFSCQPASIFLEPAGETHSNRMGLGGAHVLVIQPDSARHDVFGPVGDLLDRPWHMSHAGIAAGAWTITRELTGGDNLTSLAIETAALQMVVLAGRTVPDTGRRVIPRWLREAQAMLHALYAEPLRMQDIAAAVGVHPAHLARAFRTYFGVPPSEYVRRLRLEWAASQLVCGEAPLASVAVEAGFADQSHFTRAFRRHTGLTPDRYRRMLGRPKAGP
jgi:AraC family transcriptional regulator